MAARRDEIVPAHDLAADEPSRDVGMDGLRGIERGLATPERPGPRLLVACREERDQVEGLREPSYDLPERRLGAAAELHRLLGRQLRKLCLQLEIDSVVPAVDELEEGLRGQRFELGRKLTLPLRQTPARVEMREQPFEVGDLSL